jgi:tripartite-type tricarboxylate transporter receptor subunit TctC
LVPSAGEHSEIRSDKVGARAALRYAHLYRRERTMKLRRRRFLHLAAGAAALPAVSRVAAAQTYPTRPVRIIVAFAAGSTSDIAARLIGQRLSDKLGPQFVIDNRPGAGGNIGTELVVKSPPDGYTLLEVASANAINATLYDKLNFNFVRDIVPVASIIRIPLVLVVHPAVPANTVPEFITYARANPGKLNMGSQGVGSVHHVSGELFKFMTGVDMTHVPYRGNPVPDLLGGQVQVVFSPLPPAIEYIKAGTLRALGVTTASRQEALPGLPTVSDFVPGYEASGWNGIGAPKNTPDQIINKLNIEINTAIADPEMRAQFSDIGCSVLSGSPSDFGRLITAETEKWGKVVKFAGIKPQ